MQTTTSDGVGLQAAESALSILLAIQSYATFQREKGGSRGRGALALK